jgi:hypothetical protein
MILPSHDLRKTASVPSGTFNGCRFWKKNSKRKKSQKVRKSLLLPTGTTFSPVENMIPHPFPETPQCDSMDVALNQNQLMYLLPVSALKRS